MFNQEKILDAMYKDCTLQELPEFEKLLKDLDQEQDLDQRLCIVNGYFYGMYQCDDTYYDIYSLDDILDCFDDCDEAFRRAVYARKFKTQYKNKYWK